MVLVRSNGARWHMISCYLSEETYEMGKKSGIRWAHLIGMGLLTTQIQSKFNTLMLQYRDLEEKQRRTAELLGKYAGGSNVLE